MRNRQRDSIAMIKKQWVRLTRVCNNRCLFCLDKQSQDGRQVSLERIRDTLIMGRRQKATRAVLSGGEPTLHGSFFDIVAMTKELGYEHTQVITNGRLFSYRVFLDQAMERGLDEVTFSFHGHQASLHDRQTRVRGSFGQSLLGLLNALKKRTLIVSVDIVVNKMNVRYLPRILSYFMKLGVTEFDLLQVIPFGDAWTHKDRVLYDYRKFQPYLREVFELSKRPHIHIWTNRFPAVSLEGFEHLLQHPVKLYGEVENRKNMFERFLKSEGSLSCWGKRCRFCFLEDFCADVVKLKSEKILTAKNPPFCSTLKGKNKKWTLARTEPDFLNFCNYFINNRLTLKSQTCRSCPADLRCEGFPYEHVRENGFGVCAPLSHE